MDTLPAAQDDVFAGFFAFLDVIQEDWAARAAVYIETGADAALLGEMAARQAGARLPFADAERVAALKTWKLHAPFVTAAGAAGAERLHRAMTVLEAAQGLLRTAVHRPFQYPLGPWRNGAPSPGFAARHAELLRRTPPRWLALLLGLSPQVPFDAGILVEALERDGFTARHLLTQLFVDIIDYRREQDIGYRRAARNRFLRTPGLTALLDAERDILLAELQPEDGDGYAIADALDLATQLGIAEEGRAAALDWLLRSDRKGDRRMGWAAAPQQPTAFAVAARVLETGSTTARADIVPLLMTLDSQAAVPRLHAQRAKEKAAKVVEVLDSVIAALAPTVDGTDDDLQPPPYTRPDRTTQLPHSLAERLLPALQQKWTDMVRYPENVVRPGDRLPELAEAQGLVDFLNGGPFPAVHPLQPRHLDYFWQKLAPELALPQLRLAHLMRSESGLSQPLRLGWWRPEIDPGSEAWKTLSYDCYFSLPGFLWALAARQDSADLRALADLMEDAGMERGDLLRGWIDGVTVPQDLDTAADRYWPYVLEQADLLAQALQSGDATKDSDARILGMQSALAVLPQIPQRLVPGLLDRAFGEGGRLRAGWLEQLARRPDAAELTVQQLSAAQAGRRSRAAAFLARQGYRRALPALQDALAREKGEAVRGELLAAIHDLGGDISAALSLKELERKAAKPLAKEAPELAWIPWDGLPSLHWAADGKPVPAHLQRAWILDAIGAKQAAPSGYIRALVGLVRPEDARRQALQLVEIWAGGPSALLDFDGLARHFKVAHPDAFAKVEYEAQLYGTASLADKPELQALFKAEALRLLEGTCGGPRAIYRGMLALAGPAAGPEAVAPLMPLIRKAKGDRRAEIIAAAELLAQIDAPAAMQGLLAISHRFGTGTVREAVDASIADLAERRGWTRDALADRAVPDLGLDGDGRRVLDYASRAVVLQLTEDMALELSVDGKRAKTLPAAQDGDDPDAKKLLTALRAELQATLHLQVPRLRTAMLDGRRWTATDWQALVQAHPVMGRLAQRLVWMLPDGTSFRPHPDGALLDAGDAPVALQPDAEIELAHETRLDPATVAAWAASLADYRLAPPFPQFGRAQLPSLPEGAKALDDFQGWSMDCFKLRSEAGKRGWKRGPVGDGGGFTTYVRLFPALKLEAQLHFSGSAVPEENFPAALVELRFARDRKPLPLAEVPAMPLYEAYADMAEIARSGSGFDPDWAGKTDY